MAPSPQENISQQQMDHQSSDSTKNGHRIVISGMSGVFPKCSSVKDLCDVLYNKENPITRDQVRWNVTHPEISSFAGSVPGLNHFDAHFFKVHFNLSMNMEPMIRKLLEHAFQAIYDAGLSPAHLSGKNVGVYIGSCFSESEKYRFYNCSSKTGFGIPGCSKTMYANRISYWLNLKGPSMALDQACCSSIAALEHACHAILRGECESAIVGGSNLCLLPHSSISYGRVLTLCKDGETKSFDEHADGCNKTEAINILFIQTAKDALRIYGEIVDVKTEFVSIPSGDTGPIYSFYRDPDAMKGFLANFYERCAIPPQKVEYVEAFGSADRKVDKIELEAIDEVFCKNRKNALLVGSVMSNVGYGEAASGITAIIKVLLGFHKGKIAANLHYQNPRKDIEALQEGRIQIVNDHKEFQRTYAAVNGLTYTGVNSHVLLNGHYKPKDLGKYKSSIPHLVTISARQDTAVEKILSDLKSKLIDPEELALYHNIHEMRIQGHLGRGYSILDTDENLDTVSLVERVEYFDGAQRPLWFVFSGMGSQWPGMAVQLMRIPIFAAAMERCQKVMKPLGYDIIEIVTSPDEKVLDNIVHCFVGIAAVQIGLTDILKAIGLVPDNIIGHSAGELGCAYADGCLTAEEMILSAYSRGKASMETRLIKGCMAAVGLGYKQIVEICPEEIQVACHNGPESSTISGPADIVKHFVAELTAKGIFAKEVPCSNIAYHSKYIAEVGPGLLKLLKQVIKNPKLRSERWLSTSVPQDKWHEPSSKICSAEYLANNLLNAVLFEEACQLVPKEAVLLEIAPHGLLQAILNRSLPVECKNIPLTRRGHKDNALFVLESIGKLFMEGYNFRVSALYPKVEFPVSTGTSFLSHQVEWAHSEKWPLSAYVSSGRRIAATSKFVISLHDEEYSYLRGHVVRGKVVYPFAATLVAVWDTLAWSLGATKRTVSVQFQDVNLYAQPILHDQRQLKISVSLHKGTGYFEVLDDISTVATGYIIGNVVDTTRAFRHKLDTDEKNEVQSRDVYEILCEKEFSYSGEFQSIYSTNTSFTEAYIKWNKNWVTLIDGILQLNILRNTNLSCPQIRFIRKIVIDIREHSKTEIIKNVNESVVTANIFNMRCVTRCAGIIVSNIEFHNSAHFKRNTVALRAVEFIPHFQHGKTDISTALEVYLQVVAQNICKKTLNIVEFVNKEKTSTVFKEIVKIINIIPDSCITYKEIDEQEIIRKPTPLTADLVLIQNLSADEKLRKMLYHVLHPDTFVMNQERQSKQSVMKPRPTMFNRIVSIYSAQQTRLEMMRWCPAISSYATVTVSVLTPSDIGILTATRNSLPSRHKLVIHATNPPAPGLVEMVKTWRNETNKNQIMLLIDNDAVENRDLTQLPDLDLAFNVIDKGVLGGEYYLHIPKSSSVNKCIALQSPDIGNLDCWQWVEVPSPSCAGISVTVQYAALNDFDVKRAAGLIPFESGINSNRYGMDFSGRTESGERVMGLLQAGAVSSQVQASPHLIWPVPAHWSLEDAATVPFAYCHAFYCLAIKCKIGKGMRVLIHGGAGALGQAAISIALFNGCEVFATVSDVRKKIFLNKLFPELKYENIGNSRDNSFGDMVLNATNGDGCDLIINCVRGDLKNISLKCSAFNGVTIDTTQVQNQENFQYGMFFMTKQRSYLPTDFSSIFKNQNINTFKALQLMVSEGIAKGYVRPLSRITYSSSEASRAFRLLSGSRHRGRVLLRIGDSIPTAQPRLNCTPELCQLIVCDKDGFGLQLAKKLVECGAKNLHLHCTSPLTYLRLKIKTLQAMGANIDVSSQNLSDNHGVIAILNQGIRMGAIEGIYIIVPADKTSKELKTVISNIDMVSQKYCPFLKYFCVVTPNISVGRQTCNSRAEKSLPATLLHIPNLCKTLTGESGGDAISHKDGINVIEEALSSKRTVVVAQRHREKRTSLLQQIACIAGTKLSPDIKDTTTLEDVLIDDSKSLEVKTFLRDEYNVSLAKEDIPMLSVQKIRELENTLNDVGFREEKGLSTFFSFLDSDELKPNVEMLFIPTLYKSDTLRGDDFDVSPLYLCIIPGLEGHHERFRVMCERLKVPALVLQPGLDHLNETVQETAQRYAKVLLKRTEIKDNFYLLGYESGVLVALEVAAILEAQGLTGTVFCLGCAPDELKIEINKQLSAFNSDEKLQDAIIRHIYYLLTGDEGLVEIEIALRGAVSFCEKIDKFVKMDGTQHTEQYTRALIETAFARIQQVRQYNIQPKVLQSRIVLLHANTDNKTNTNLLQQYSKQPVFVHELKAPLAHVTKDLRCCSFINRHLSPKLLEDFSKTNFCDSYLLIDDLVEL